MENATRESMRDIVRVGYGGRGIQLTEVKPEELLDAPEPRGKGHYGLADLGFGNKLAVMVDVTAATEDFQQRSSVWGTLYVGTAGDSSLAEALARQLSPCCGEITTTLSLDYEGETAPFTVSVFANINPQYAARPTPTPPGYEMSEEERRKIEQGEGSGSQVSGYQVSASLNNITLRVGQLPSGETFILDNTSGTANFEMLNSTRVLQDLNGDGFVLEGQSGGEVVQASQAVLVGSSNAWEIHSVSASGMKVELQEKQTGVLTGKVMSFVGAAPVAGARVRVWPGEFEATTAEDGSYRLEAYEGAIWKILVTKEGRIPFEASSWPGQYRGQNQESLNINIRAGKETSYAVELAELPEQVEGIVTLEGVGALYTALGLVFRNTLGDFYFQVNSYQTAEGTRTDASVCACQESQRGLVEMGDQGSTPLDQITIPPFGYTQNWVQLKAGHVYVVKARKGLEGHFVVFRVETITEQGAKITYLFR